VGQGGKRGIRSWLVAAGIGACAGLILWGGFSVGSALWPERWPAFLRPRTVRSARPGASSQEATKGTAQDGKSHAAAADQVAEGLAMAYARAFQSGAWDNIIRRTCWMEARLARVRLESSDPAAVVRAMADLRARLSERSVEGNHLRPEGIEDQYVFTPGARLEVIGADDGRQDLAEPAKGRTWIRVTYPDHARAPCDEKGRPLRSLVAGLNLNGNGLVLKANVLGNLEFQEGSRVYDWPAPSSTE